MQKRFVAFFALLVVSPICNAQFTPASFGDPEAEKAIWKFTEFPDVKGSMKAQMNCAVQALSNGKFKDNNCYLQNEFDMPFASALFKASKKARLVPATIDGRAKDVYLQYRVEFIKEGEEASIVLYPNPGVEENIEEYGVGHYAAQRIMGKERWIKECPQSARYRVFAKAHVGTDGKASNVSLTHGGGIVPPVACQNAIIKNVAESPYIPAFADGVAVPSTFVEPFGNY